MFLADHKSPDIFIGLVLSRGQLWWSAFFFFTYSYFNPLILKQNQSSSQQATACTGPHRETNNHSHSSQFLPTSPLTNISVMELKPELWLLRPVWCDVRGSRCTRWESRANRNCSASSLPAKCCREDAAAVWAINLVSVMADNIIRKRWSPSGFTPLYDHHKWILHTHFPWSTCIIGLVELCESNIIWRFLLALSWGWDCVEPTFTQTAMFSFSQLYSWNAGVLLKFQEPFQV